MGNTDNPHVITALQVGLGNINNTSDIAKPISTVTQAALDDKADASTVGIPTVGNAHGVVQLGSSAAAKALTPNGSVLSTSNFTTNGAPTVVHCIKTV